MYVYKPDKGSGKKSKKAKAIARIVAGSWGALSTGLLSLGSALKGDIPAALMYGALAGTSIYGILKGKKGLQKLKKDNIPNKDY